MAFSEQALLDLAKAQHQEFARLLQDLSHEPWHELSQASMGLHQMPIPRFSIDLFTSSNGSLCEILRAKAYTEL